MFTEETIEYLRTLYKRIFNEDANNSKEFINFVQNGNPHPLRIKVEDIAQELNNNILDQCTYSNNGRVTKPIMSKISLITALDSFITDYIENKYVWRYK